ncbi:hypothetical protein EMCG_00482 [[Emmonsia] crescens]|uniref:Uncharacterized protein n=1 Tax=[Emmonsia] crescens TaxID=73230 RepID=A0A0G2HVZ3_9EURO|nr:hypothetical protein EMCG_00482 [Emmonsia crescens UAMH 3008]
MHCPEPPPDESKLSISHLARLYCRERLLVEPFLWTSRHVELLQFTFEPPTIAPSLLQPGEAQPTGLPQKYACVDLVRNFVRGGNVGPTWRESAIFTLMDRPGSPFVALADNLTFNFKHCCVRTLECLTLYHGDLEAAKRRRIPPFAIFFDREHVEYKRLQFVNGGSTRTLKGWRHGRRKRQTPQTLALFNAKLKKLTPPNPLHDPYTVAVLISLAQAQRYHLRVMEPEKDADAVFLAQVLFLDPSDTNHLHLFATDISSSFLDKLDFPTVPPSDFAQTSASIRHTVVPCEPFETLRHRIFKLLLPSFGMQEQNSKDQQINKSDHS